MEEPDHSFAPGEAGWTPLPHVALAGHPVAIASRAALVETMAADCRAARASATPRPRLVFDLNGHGLSLARTDPAYRAALARADVVHADGGFLVTLSHWRARWANVPAVAERSVTTDLFHDFARRAERDELSFFLLGGTEAVNAACARRLAASYPRLAVVGRHHGYFSPREEDAVIAAIDAARPDILWIGLGKPLEQLFAARNAHRLRAGWAVTCGGCFHYVTGDYPRAPLWMQRANLEWLHRMATGPRHLVWRYLTTTPHALWLALRWGLAPPDDAK